jgi:hypothetical protein
MAQLRLSYQRQRGKQIDGLGHITVGDDNHWYNGFKESDWGGNWGIRKADAVTIPPIVTRAIMIDVAGYQKVDALKSGTAITVDDLKKTLEWEKVDIQPGDAVFIRTGTLRYWGDAGSDHDKSPPMILPALIWIQRNGWWSKRAPS